MYGKHADILSKQCPGGHVSRVRFSWIGILAIPVCSVVAALKNSNQRKVLKLIDADSKTMSSADLKVVPLAPIWGSYGFLISARVLVLSFLGRLLQSLVERVVAHEQKVQDLKAQKLSQHAVWPSYQSYQSNIIKPSYHSEIVENTWNICRKWPAASNVKQVSLNQASDFIGPRGPRGPSCLVLGLRTTPALHISHKPLMGSPCWSTAMGSGSTPCHLYPTM
jgi:hypothetical protein